MAKISSIYAALRVLAITIRGDFITIRGDFVTVCGDFCSSTLWFKHFI